MGKGLTPPTGAAEFLGGVFVGGGGMTGEVKNLAPRNSVCVKPISDCESFPPLSSLPPNCCPRGHRNNQARGVKI